VTEHIVVVTTYYRFRSEYRAKGIHKTKLTPYLYTYHSKMLPCKLAIGGIYRICYYDATGYDVSRVERVP
jgi:hypothetical protein